MSSVISDRWYKDFLLFPVLDDDGVVEYWDVHENNGEHSSDHDPVAWGFSTLADAKAWVNSEKQYLRAKKSFSKYAG